LVAKHGRPELLTSITNNNLKTYLRALPGFEKVDTYRPHGEPRRYKLMRLRSKSERGEDD
jgi:hypothetical protein